jgi:phosphoribosylformimino-5-aminoimidazole carboxamide ribotide isomerase
MQIIPIMDIYNQVVVLLKRTGPQKYYPLESILVDNVHPLSVLQAFREKLGAQTFYITDLNARHREGNNFKIIKEMSTVRGITLLVDAGVGTAKAAQRLLQTGVTKVVIGTKYLDSMNEAKKIIDTIGVENVIFAVEMEQYQTYADSLEVKKLRPLEFIHRLWDFGLRDFIVLELSALGTAQGVQTTLLEFLHTIIEQFKGISLITGGGIRNIQDLVALRDIGISGVLIGTALHKGTLTARDIEQLQVKQTSKGFLSKP